MFPSAQSKKIAKVLSDKGFTSSQIQQLSTLGTYASRGIAKRIKDQQGTPPKTPKKDRGKPMDVDEVANKKSQQMGGRKRKSAVAQLVTRSAMKKTGKTKVKKGPKKVKVTKTFRAKVKKCEEGESARGSYTKVWAGYVGSVTNADTTGAGANNVSIQGTVMGTAGEQLVYGPNHLQPAGARSLFHSLVKPNMSTVTGSDMNFFTIRKIQDAASLCFNRRTVAFNPHASDVGLLGTMFNPVTGLGFAPLAGGLKIQLTNSWVQFTMKNVSDRVIEMDIWELTPKLKFQNTSPLTSLLATYNGVGQIAADRGGVEDNEIKYVTRLGTGINDDFALESNVDAVSMARRYGFNFDIVKRSMVLAPDETCKHSIKGPKGLIDFSKLQVENQQQQKLLKGVSVSCIISVRGDQVWAPGQAITAGQRLARTAVPVAASSIVFGMPVAIEIEESMSMVVPEIAGFTTSAGVAGTQQTLNMRKKRIVYANFIDENGDTSVVGGAPVAPTVIPYTYGVNAYQVSNEVNPAAPVGRPGDAI